MAPFEIDLNLDAGESAAALEDGSEVALYDLVSSLNVACGGHAGDATTMAQVVELLESTVTARMFEGGGIVPAAFFLIRSPARA
ncbi:MAG: hypothetical protein HC883_02265 [Bdellovibrionaceae bacterium]|nr:hypothetical protein [Pseudobdellovibrionaceae bacterium]